MGKSEAIDLHRKHRSGERSGVRKARVFNTEMSCTGTKTRGFQGELLKAEPSVLGCPGNSARMTDEQREVATEQARVA